MFSNSHDQFPRGDWYLDLTEEYRLNRINSDCIELEKKDGSFVMDHFYIVGYCVDNNIIKVKGIQTKGDMISDEERKNQNLTYYVIRTDDDLVLGPYLSENELNINTNSEANTDWIETKDIKIGGPYNLY